MIGWNPFNLQNGYGPTIEEFILLRDYLLLVLMFILFGVIVLRFPSWELSSVIES